MGGAPVPRDWRGEARLRWHFCLSSLQAVLALLRVFCKRSCKRCCAPLMSVCKRSAVIFSAEWGKEQLLAQELAAAEEQAAKRAKTATTKNPECVDLTGEESEPEETGPTKQDAKDVATPEALDEAPVALDDWWAWTTPRPLVGPSREPRPFSIWSGRCENAGQPGQE